MESTLLIITIASLALTLVMAVMLVVTLLDKRRRSHARVTALEGMAAEAATTASVPSAFDDFEIQPVEQAFSSSELFTSRQEPSAWPTRLAVVGSIALVVLVVAMASRTLPRSSNSTVSAPAASPAVDTEGAAHLLELLSLKHDQETNALRITGLVQNPRQGALLTQVTATAMLFGGDGTFLASGRAALDFTTLRPGEESGFVITVPVTGAVARYRVGFRGEDGRIIGHVDRRLTGTIARGPS
jgi:hypothetical protein